MLWRPACEAKNTTTAFSGDIARETFQPATTDNNRLHNALATMPLMLVSYPSPAPVGQNNLDSALHLLYPPHTITRELTHRLTQRWSEEMNGTLRTKKITSWKSEVCRLTVLLELGARVALI